MRTHRTKILILSCVIPLTLVVAVIALVFQAQRIGELAVRTEYPWTRAPLEFLFSVTSKTRIACDQYMLIALKQRTSAANDAYVKAMGRPNEELMWKRYASAVEERLDYELRKSEFEFIEAQIAGLRITEHPEAQQAAPSNR